ncbi:hypothetical protein WR25_04457 [Diploscapter pachys]|uniref:Methanethiol oxidase n=1 Tax=Diploscapter pachys TaxID=2018661 RepID=A0A2A2LZ38_9BILA|nr:hypothetical protein WR25_04457 [Diploscapter pachys]
MPCGCNGKGPGYASPQEAIKGPREKVISMVKFPNKGDEVHHYGWNACSSCFDKPSAKRTHLILPCLNSDRIYVVNVVNERGIFLEKTIEPEALHKFDVSFPHTSHCLANGQIMISTLGDAKGNAKGDFLLLDGVTFEPIGKWCKEAVPFNYDFWYQPKRDVMISTEWGAPKLIKQGFNPEHVMQGQYGHSVHVHRWSTHELLQSVALPKPSGYLPLEVRFHHNPDSQHAFTGSALGSAIFHFAPKTDDSTEYHANEVITVPSKKVTNWALPEMPSLITDILVSMDDKYLYFSNWLHGDVRQYDISDPAHPKLTGKVFLGGSIHKESGVRVTEDNELKDQPNALYLKGKRIEGGPQMLQLSLDGKRLYVTTSLYRKWDEQFYPNLKKGASMMLLHVDVENGGMTLDEHFLIDFGEIEDGPYLAHEMRYPGGDCTSDIWIGNPSKI